MFSCRSHCKPVGYLVALGLLSQGIVTLLRVRMFWNPLGLIRLVCLTSLCSSWLWKEKKGMKSKFLFHYLVILCQNNCCTFLVFQLFVFLLSKVKNIFWLSLVIFRKVKRRVGMISSIQCVSCHFVLIIKCLILCWAFVVYREWDLKNNRHESPHTQRIFSLGKQNENKTRKYRWVSDNRVTVMAGHR